jgi:prevent-host-death family protein
MSVSDAKGLLTELVRRAESGEDVVLTRHGRAIVRLVAIPERPSAADRLAAMRAAQSAARELMTPGPSAARSQDFLYNDDGLPG